MTHYNKEIYFSLKEKHDEAIFGVILWQNDGSNSNVIFDKIEDLSDTSSFVEYCMCLSLAISSQVYTEKYHKEILWEYIQRFLFTSNSVHNAIHFNLPTIMVVLDFMTFHSMINIHINQ